MFIDENADIRLLTVMECSWGAKDKQVRARPFGAISLRLTGNAEITEGGKTEQMRTGDILYMPKGASYRLNCGDEHIFVLHFDTDGRADGHMSVFRLENTALIHDAFSELLSVWNEKEPGYYFKAKSLFYQIIHELERSSVRESRAEYEKIRSAVEYLHANYTDPALTVSRLCHMVFLSDTYFRRIFSALYEKNPLAYINELRISHAQVLLCETNSSVEEVARLSGFRDVKYFSTYFKKSTGVSPSSYKKGMKRKL